MKGDLQMSINEKLELLADTLDCDVEDLNVEKELTDLENWNSMTMLSLIVMLDDECGKTLTRDELDKFKTIQDILNYMG